MDIANIFSSLNIDTSQFQSELQAAKAALKAIDSEIAATNAAFKSGAMGAQNYSENMKILTENAKQLKDMLNSVSGMSGQAAQKLQLMAGAVDDLQYVGEQGLRPIINNVMMLDARLGLALITVNSFYKNWDDLQEVFRDTPFQVVTDGITSLVSGLKEAGKSFVEFATAGALSFNSVADDSARLAEVEHNVKKRADVSKKMGDRLEGLQTDEESKRGKAVKDAMAAEPGGAANFRRNLLQKRMAGQTQGELDAQVQDEAGNWITRRQQITRNVDTTLDKAMEGREGYISSLKEWTGGGDSQFSQRYNTELTADERKKTAREKAAADKKAESEAKQAQKAADAKKKHEEETKDKAYAKSLQQRFTLGAVSGTAMTPEDVKAELEKSVGADEAKRAGPSVHKLLTTNHESAVNAQMMEKGQSREEAMQSIGQEEGRKLQMEKEAREREDTHLSPAQREEKRKEDEAKRKRDQEVRGNVNDYKKSYGETSMLAMAKAKGGGKDVAETDAKLTEALTKELTNVPEAIREEVAKGIISESRQDFNVKTAEIGQNMRIYGNADGTDPRRPGKETKAEVLKVSELGRKVQESVTKPDDKGDRKSHSLLEKIHKVQAESLEQLKRPRGAILR